MQAENIFTDFVFRLDGATTDKESTNLRTVRMFFQWDHFFIYESIYPRYAVFAGGISHDDQHNIAHTFSKNP